jgi:hypothetical protein
MIYKIVIFRRAIKIMVEHSRGRFRAGKWPVFERGVRPAELERTDFI